MITFPICAFTSGFTRKSIFAFLYTNMASGWPRSFASQAEEFRKTGDRSLIWEGHFAGIEGEYYLMEKLTNQDKLPPYGFISHQDFKGGRSLG